jgi:hypothetical protein
MLLEVARSYDHLAQSLRRLTLVPGFGLAGLQRRRTLNDTDRAKIYRECAKEVRTMAQHMLPGDHRKGLLSIAETYDRLAALIEACARRSLKPK